MLPVATEEIKVAVREMGPAWCLLHINPVVPILCMSPSMTVAAWPSPHPHASLKGLQAARKQLVMKFSVRQKPQASVTVVRKALGGKDQAKHHLENQLDSRLQGHTVEF